MEPKHLYFFSGCAPEVDLLVDIRKMSNKKPHLRDAHLAPMVHPESEWRKGHMMHVFFQKKCVLSLVVPIALTGGMTIVDHTKRGLEEVQIMQCADVEYDEDTPPPSAAATAPETGAEPAAANAKPKTAKKSKV